MVSKEFEKMEKEYATNPMAAVPYAPERFTEWLVKHEGKTLDTAKIYISSLRTATKEQFKEEQWHLHYEVWKAFEAMPDDLVEYFANQIDARLWLEEFILDIDTEKFLIETDNFIATYFPNEENGEKWISYKGVENQGLALKAYCRFLEYLTYENFQNLAPFKDWSREEWTKLERDIKRMTKPILEYNEDSDEFVDSIPVEPCESIKRGDISKYSKTIRYVGKEEFRKWLINQKYSPKSVSTYLANLKRLFAEFDMWTNSKVDSTLFTDSSAIKSFGDIISMTAICQDVMLMIELHQKSLIQVKMSPESISRGKTALEKYISFLKDCGKAYYQDVSGVLKQMDIISDNH